MHQRPSASSRATPSLFGASLVALIALQAAAVVALTFAALFTPWAQATKIHDANRKVELTNTFFQSKSCVILNFHPAPDVEQCTTNSYGEIAEEEPGCKKYVSAIRAALAFCLFGGVAFSLLLLAAIFSLKLRNIRRYFLLFAVIGTGCLLISWPITFALFTQLHCEDGEALKDNAFFDEKSIGPSAILQLIAFLIGLLLVVFMCCRWCGYTHEMPGGEGATVTGAAGAVQQRRRSSGSSAAPPPRPGQYDQQQQRSGDFDGVVCASPSDSNARLVSQQSPAAVDGRDVELGYTTGNNSGAVEYSTSSPPNPKEHQMGRGQKYQQQQASFSTDALTSSSTHSAGGGSTSNNTGGQSLQLNQQQAAAEAKKTNTNNNNAFIVWVMLLYCNLTPTGIPYRVRPPPVRVSDPNSGDTIGIAKPTIGSLKKAIHKEEVASGSPPFKAEEVRIVWYDEGNDAWVELTEVEEVLVRNTEDSPYGYLLPDDV